MSGSGAARDSLQAVGPPKPETELQRFLSFVRRGRVHATCKVPVINPLDPLSGGQLVPKAQQAFVADQHAGAS